MSELREIEPVESVAEDIANAEEAVAEVKKPVKKAKPKNKWVVDAFKATKKCPECGQELHGWAYRQSFRFCPFCGVENQ